jgi:hypothetical protein
VQAGRNKKRDKSRVSPENEEALERAWRTSGDFFILALQVAESRSRNEPPPEWLHKALLEHADHARPTAEIKLYQREAIRWTRYIAVREGHDREGLTWENAAEWAAEQLRDTPSAASPKTMAEEYKRVRKALRAAHPDLRNDDPGYRWAE